MQRKIKLTYQMKCIHTHLVSLILVLALGAAGLTLSGCSASSSGNPIVDMLSDFMPPSPREAALDLFNVYDADKRRRAVALIAASPFGGEEPYVRTYRVMLGRGSDGSILPVDNDATVRATCAKALGMHGTVDDAELIVPLLKDEVPYVRWQAAQALQRIHNPVVINDLTQAMVNDEDADVRMASARALGQYAEMPVFESLVGALSDNNFGVVNAAHWSLTTQTGEDLGTKGDAWLSWASKNRGNMFAKQKKYVYELYLKPPGLIDKMKFWKDDDKAEAKQPIGSEL
ncbi:HEAT repeat domain-containing protein [Poriferisphaera sp. WC338]|uniref:HEAT repeat domain-containing protein n=1 Tax=Poriferisphaera sp. WC338 TaxID=3425129 RepID=UPI003D8170EE